ncbi:hypothetical protein OG552_21795 [Streptomyces sp. NBC_01476]|uniref:hypothetical protein n=1 Tax=Streptomyces sp. NBC_01476 TaxID=2903881 RepID=UPI002E355F3F|nr:hypothetical protein [Streptomyces sp. NBC_01476]
MRVVRSTTLAVAAVTSLLGLAACSGGSHDSASGDGDRTAGPSVTASSPATSPGGGKDTSVAQAVEALNVVEKRADAANSAKIESTMKAGDTMSTRSTGAMDWSDGNKAEMTITYTGGTYRDTIEKAGLGDTMRARYLTDAYYVNMGQKMSDQIGGKHWIRYGYDDLAKVAGGSGAFLSDQLQNNNPSRSVQYIMASPNVHKVGSEDVRGVPTTHYSGTLDVDDVTEQTSTDMTPQELADLQKTLKTAGVTTEQVDLWVSSDNLPVKAVSSAHASTGDTESTTYYSDFGTKVSVRKPAAGDYVDFTEMTGAP